MNSSIPGIEIRKGEDSEIINIAGKNGTVTKKTATDGTVVYTAKPGADPKVAEAISRRKATRQAYIDSLAKGEKVTIKGTHGENFSVDAKEFYRVWGDRPLTEDSYMEVAGIIISKEAIHKTLNIPTEDYQDKDKSAIMGGRMGGRYVAPAITFKGVNQDAADFAMASMNEQANKLYSSLGTEQDYVFNSMNAETSNVVLSQAKATPQSFDVYYLDEDNAWTKAEGQKSTFGNSTTLSDVKKGILEGMNGGMRAAPNNTHSQVAFQSLDGQIMIMPNEPKFAERMTKAAEKGTPFNSTVNNNKMSKAASAAATSITKLAPSRVPIQVGDSNQSFKGKILPVTTNPFNSKAPFRLAELTKEDGTIYYVALEYSSTELFIPNEYASVEALYQDLQNLSED